VEAVIKERRLSAAEKSGGFTTGGMRSQADLSAVLPIALPPKTCSQLNLNSAPVICKIPYRGAATLHHSRLGFTDSCPWKGAQLPTSAELEVPCRLKPFTGSGQAGFVTDG
jgi:hypothetical protein